MKKVRLPGHPYPEDVSDEFAASLEARRQAYGENAIASDLDSIGGVVARASLRDGNNNEVLSCDVSAVGGGGAIELSNLAVAPGQEVRCDGLSYVAPP